MKLIEIPIFNEHIKAEELISSKILMKSTIYLKFQGYIMIDNKYKNKYFSQCPV